MALDSSGAVGREGDRGGVPAAEAGGPPPPRVRSRARRWSAAAGKVLLAVVGLWLLAAYVILPALWKHYEHHPSLEDAPKVTVTSQGIPGDPLNVGFVATEGQIVQAMLMSGWDPADPVTLRSSLRIAGSVLRNKPYPDAPVSPLFVFGRKQDLAFERPAGPNASRRHHVRFWQAPEYRVGDVPLWIGAVTYDRSVGLSRTTGQITHHIGPDVDAERDALMREVEASGWIRTLYQVTGVGATMFGRNGGGDPYFTDGEMSIGVLNPGPQKEKGTEVLANPSPVRIKDQLWTAVRPLLQAAEGADSPEPEPAPAPVVK